MISNLGSYSLNLQCLYEQPIPGHLIIKTIISFIHPFIPRTPVPLSTGRPNQKRPVIGLGAVVYLYLGGTGTRSAVFSKPAVVK